MDDQVAHTEIREAVDDAAELSGSGPPDFPAVKEFITADHHPGGLGHAKTGMQLSQ